MTAVPGNITVVQLPEERQVRTTGFSYRKTGLP